jgi:hypothetical protein
LSLQSLHFAVPGSQLRFRALNERHRADVEQRRVQEPGVPEQPADRFLFGLTAVLDALNSTPP